jgi:hypothetical protein
MDAALEVKIRELADRQEIWCVMQRYGRGLDRLDVELVRSCYFDDCIEDHGHYIGSPDGFIDWANAVALRYESTLHGLMNHHCELSGDDAYCETYFFFNGIKRESPHLMSTGRYIDHFQRRNGEWRIANRVTIVEGTFDIPESLETRMMPPAYGPDELRPATRDRNDVSYQRPLRPRRPRGAAQ